MRSAKICLLLLSAVTGPAFATEAVVDTALPLEIKGQALGSSLDEVQSRFPGAQCGDLQPGLTRCSKDDTLAESPARLDLSYLDGRLISIRYGHIDFKLGLAIDQALTEKFGAPNVRQVNGTVDHGTYRGHRKSSWVHGDQVLHRDPLGERDDKHHRTYTEVWLVDVKAWDGTWLPRKRGQHAVKDL